MEYYKIRHKVTGQFLVTPIEYHCGTYDNIGSRFYSLSEIINIIKNLGPKDDYDLCVYDTNSPWFCKKESIE